MKYLLLICVFLFVGCGQPTPMTSKYVVQSFKDAGLAAVDAQPITALPTNAVEATFFDMPGVGNGRVTTFQAASDALHFKSIIEYAGGWYFQKGIVLVVLSESVDEATARQYMQVLDDLRF